MVCGVKDAWSVEMVPCSFHAVSAMAGVARFGEEMWKW